MLLIEEPEAHLHAQRQLKIMKSLQKEADENGVQVLISTHSPLLASALKVENLVMLQSGKAFSLATAHTKLSTLDYRFLDRFLDATKANLFFAKGVVIVEGDAENILLPAIAHILDRDFSDYGISVVNVGGTGLRRYSNIFQREDEDQGIINVPIACITDMDVMSDCAPQICLSSVESSDPATWPEKKNRRWRAICDYKDGELDERRKQISEKCDGQKVKSFVADHWTLEYDLAREGLGEEVYIAAKLAIKDEKNVPAADSVKQVGKDAIKYYADNLIEEVDDVRASKIYSEFTTGTKASKSIAAQYLACLLENRYGDDPARLADKLPPYVKCAIEHVSPTITLGLRIPSDKLEQMLGGLAAMGKVTTKSLSLEDVTGKYIDTETRLATKKELRDRLKELLEKAVNVKDILAIEKELYRIQADIDSMTARLESLKGKVDYASLTVTLKAEMKERVLGPLGYVWEGSKWCVKKLFVWQDEGYEEQ